MYESKNCYLTLWLAMHSKVKRIIYSSLRRLRSFHFYDQHGKITFFFVFYILSKVHIFGEGHKILRNLHLTFVLSSTSLK